MSKIINDEAFDVLFRQARTQNAWTDESVSETMLRAVYDLMKWGATSANCSPARFVFVTSKAAKERLVPHLMGSNRAKTLQAPVCVIIGNDMKFHEKMSYLFAHDPGLAKHFADNDAVGQETAFRNGTLQGAYLMLAARALGLDCGPMSGFDKAGVDAEFFAGTSIKSNFLCNIGHGDPKGVLERLPRLPFEQACQIV